MKKIIGSVMLGLSSLVILGACSTTNESINTQHSEHPSGSMNSSSMEMPMHDSGEIPDNMKKTENPKYPFGTEVKLVGGHMSGMKGAQATVVGAYDTTIYAVTYLPTDGGEEVENHKWVVQEELKESNESYSKGDRVVLEADHMEGMKGATATIDQAINGTAYIVDYEPTDGGKTVTNHKWLTEEELTEQ